MRSISRLLAALTSAALLISLTVAPTLAGSPVTTFWVDDDHMAAPGNCNSTDPAPLSIQGAVNVASPDSTIMVCPGLYPETISITTPGLTLKSVKRWKATVTPPSDFSAGTALVTVTAVPGVSIKGFRFATPTTGDCEPVAFVVKLTDTPYTQIRDNKMVSTGGETLGYCGYSAGVYVTGGSGGSEINRNRITDFKMVGIHVAGEYGDVLLRYNRINFLHPNYPAGLVGTMGIYAAAESGTVTIKQNRIRSLDSGGNTTSLLGRGIYVAGAHFDVRGNRIRNVQYAIYAGSGQDGRINNNRAVQNVQVGLLLQQATNVEIAQNSMSGWDFGVAVQQSTDNNFHDNDWGNSAGTADCYDDSSGGGTANTANTWTNNLGATSSPAGICTPAP